MGVRRFLVLVRTPVLTASLALLLSAAPLPVKAANKPAAEVSSSTLGQPVQPPDCTKILTVLKEQQRSNRRDFRRLQRELVAVKQQLSEPGINEILGGIGYILGLFGIAYYVSARRREKRDGEGD